MATRSIWDPRPYYFAGVQFKKFAKSNDLKPNDPIPSPTGAHTMHVHRAPMDAAQAPQEKRE